MLVYIKELHFRNFLGLFSVPCDEVCISMLFPRISWCGIFVDLGFIVLVNLLLLSVCSTQANVKNGSDTSHLEKKTHRTHLNNETAPIPIVKELGNFLTWFFGMPDDEHNSTKIFNSSVPESSTVRSTTTVSNIVTSIPASKLARREDDIPQRRLQVVPRVVRKVNSSSPSARQIQITDIQTAIGTELTEDDHDQDPSQINLQDELESIDKFEKKVAQDYDIKDDENRSKRDLPINGIQRPYINSGNEHLQRSFANRQGLLLSPVQQVLAFQQQQAAALLQQQALRQGIGYRRPYFYDDYDDSDYDDSDSLEDDDSMGFFNPVRDGMRRGQFFPPPPPLPPFLGGIGRRSVDEQLSKSHHSDADGNNEEILESPVLKVKTSRRHSSAGPLRRNGEWTLIDDYDLSSDFHRSRKGFLSAAARQDELDEDVQENVNRGGVAGAKWGKGKQCIGKRCKKQGENETTTTENPGDNSTTASSSEPSSMLPTLAPGGGLSTIGGGLTTPAPPESSTLPSPGGNSSMNPLPTSLPVNSTSLPMNSTLPSSTPSTDINSTMISSTTTSPSENSTESSSQKPMGQKPPYKANANCRCGAQSVRGEMITRGAVIRVHTNPWLFAISNRNKHLCSGTLINNRYVLTAAQCVQGVNRKQLTVMGGLATRASLNFTVNRVIIHPNYSPSDSSAHDLALLRLNNVVQINQMMRPICLPLSSRSREPVSTGALTTWIQKSSQLQMLQTDVKVLENSKCNSSVVDFSRGQLCTSPPGKTSCGGDSSGRGGSLQATSGDFSYDQIGVVTSTIGCRTNNSPGVYTDIRNYTRWILTQTKDARYCNKPKIKPMDLAALVDIESRSDHEESEDEEEEEEDDFNILFQ